MNLNKLIKKTSIILTLVMLSVNFSNAQEEAKDSQKLAVERLIESKNFTFIAQTATPMGGRFINLNSVYDLKITADTLNSDLPYFGRAFVAPMNPTESALRFTSTEFNYDIKERKKGGWDITIRPKDAKDVRQMYMTISENGYATLQVTSNNRQPISFNGVIQETGRR
jgi:hypothetical protein